MLFVPEAESATLATHEMAYTAVKEAPITVRDEGAHLLAKWADEV